MLTELSFTKTGSWPGLARRGLLAREALGILCKGRKGIRVRGGGNPVAAALLVRESLGLKCFLALGLRKMKESKALSVF